MPKMWLRMIWLHKIDIMCIGVVYNAIYLWSVTWIVAITAINVQIILLNHYGVRFAWIPTSSPSALIVCDRP